MRWLYIINMVVWACCVVMMIAVVSKMVELGHNRHPVQEWSVSFGNKVCAMRPGEASVFELPSGAALYVMCLPKPLKVIPAMPLIRE